MDNLFKSYGSIPVDQWDYYFDIDEQVRIPFPFTGEPAEHNYFIREYFTRGGKAEAMESVALSFDNLRLPNHINSVFFLGIMVYNNTSLHRKYKLENNAPGYKSFPFIWFLIALYHDNAYEMEGRDKLVEIQSVEELCRHFDIAELLLDKIVDCRYRALLDSRRNYFLYRKRVSGVVDHGILGSILLYDRLVKIRAEKKKENKGNRFWGRKLVNQYLKAANAISLHNIWMPTRATEQIYRDNNLEMLIGIQKVRFLDFPLFYILAVIDTIEPLKIYKDLKLPDIKILTEICIEFKKDGISLLKQEGSDLDFSRLIDKARSLENWIDIGVRAESDLVEITFHY